MQLLQIYRSLMQKNSKANCSHIIKLENFHDGEVVNYSLLLIRGSVNPSDNCTNLILLNVGNKSLTENICPISGEFKVILDLSSFSCEKKSTSLILHFKYCNTELKIELILDLYQDFLYRLQPIYILCCDEEETEVAKLNCETIDVNLRVIQSLYADRIQQAGLPRKTFALNGNCGIYRTDLTLSEALSANEQTLWLKLAEELLRKNRFEESGERKLKLIAFIGCTKYDGKAVAASGDLSYANIKKYLQAYAALGGGDLALFSSAYFYAWPQTLEQIVPCFLSKKQVNPATEADESNYRRTYGGVYASTLGAVCHEIGHIFDLGHDDGIMGAGLDYVNRVFTINSRTENLPRRVFGNATKIDKFQSANSRVTKFAREKQNFLENYREQKKNCGFYFTRNCALMLFHHRWFNKRQIADECDKNNLITFDCKTGTISTKKSKGYLKIIELRSNTDSRVLKFYEIKDPNTFKFNLPSDVFAEYQTAHHLFVMCNNGLSKRFELC